jgi:hypothetical protein
VIEHFCPSTVPTLFVDSALPQRQQLQPLD